MNAQEIQGWVDSADSAFKACATLDDLKSARLLHTGDKSSISGASRSLGTLSPDEKESVNFDTTQNLIIEGDNLEVLKLLQKSYQGKVKMIYIDPPYNTGNDFIYPISYSFYKNIKHHSWRF